ncbi:hypothetical protein SARC_10229, partial [Sphaeroforma arctica JP610]
QSDIDEEKYHNKISASPWWRTCITMTTEVLGLAVIAMPEASAKIGWLSLVVLVIALGFLATWTGLLLRDIKLRHRKSIHEYSDVAKMMFGTAGGRIISFWMYISVFSEAAAQILTGGIALVNITEGKQCLALCISAAAFIGCLLTQLRTFHALTVVSIVGLVTIVIPLMTTVIALPLQNVNHRANAYAVAVVTDASFKDIFNAIMTVVFGYGGHVFYFAFMSEMKNPADFKKALFVSQSITVTIFLLSATLIYVYAGPTVEAPAVDSLESLNLRRLMHVFLLCHTVVVCAIAMITLMKSLYPILYSWKEYTIWTPQTAIKYLSLSSLLFICGYVVVELIPFMDDFLAMVSAVTILPFTFILPPLFTLIDKRRMITKEGRTPTRSESSYMFFCGAVVMGGVMLAFAGTTSAFMDIVDKYTKGGYGGPFTCATEAYYPLPFPEEELRDR